MTAMMTGQVDVDSLELFPDLAGFSSRSMRSRNPSGSVESDVSSIVDGELGFGDDTDLLKYLTTGENEDYLEFDSDDVSELGTGNSRDLRNLLPSQVIRGTVRTGKTVPVMNTRPSVLRKPQAEKYDRTVLNVSYPNVKNKTDPPTMTKSAIAARENRVRKKFYTTSLEVKNKELDSENLVLKSKVRNMSKSLSSLNKEVQYLRAVLANQSSLSALLKNIPNCKDDGLQLSTCLRSSQSNVDSQTPSQNKRNASSTNSHCPPEKIQRVDHAYATPDDDTIQAIIEESDSETEMTFPSNTTATAGVCLHVSGKKVSLEFCAQCSQRAGSS